MVFRFLLFVFCALPLLQARAQTATLADYQAHYTNNLARIEAAFLVPEADAVKQYLADLQELELALRTEGNLEAVLVCRKEIERYRSTRAVPDRPPEDVSLEMRKVHYRYHRTVLSAALARDQRIAALLNRYRQALEALQKKQVQALQVDAAVRTRSAVGGTLSRQEEIKQRMSETRNAMFSIKQEMEAALPIKPPGPGFSRTVRLPPSVLRNRVVHYTFDRDERTQASDTSGRRHHGVVKGAKWVREGKIGGGMEFDFHRTYVTIPTEAMGNWDAVSYTVWVKVREYKGSNWPAFIGSSTRLTGLNVSLGIAQGRGTLYAEVDTEHANTPIHGGEIAIPWDTWFHAAMVYDGETLTEYLNGEPGISVSARGKLNPVEQLYLGRSSGDYNPRASLIGRLDEAVIFDRALSAKEVKAIYRAQR
jgi:hypothetical protein